MRFIKLLLCSLHILYLNVAVAQDDKAALLSFLEPLQVLAKTDEGGLKDDNWHQKKIGYYNQKGTAFAALPSTVSAGVECLEGDCLNGTGRAKYLAVNAQYYGEFQDGYPNNRGLIINADGDTMIVTHLEGMLDGKQALQLKNDKDREYLFVEYQLGDLAKTSNFHLPEYGMYYEGIIDDFAPMKEGVLYGSGCKVDVIFHDSGALRAASGKIAYQKDMYYEGRLIWKNNGFVPSEKGVLHNSSNGTRIDITFMDDGKPRLQQMSIWKGDTLYVGPVDENFYPHGKGGRVDIDGSTVKEGIWEHGVYMGKYGRQVAQGPTFSVYDESGRNNRDGVIRAVRERLGLSAFGKQTLYEGVPTSNSFSIEVDEFSHYFIGIWIINFSDNDHEVCVNPRFPGSDKRCFNMKSLAQLDQNGEIDFNTDAIEAYGYNLPTRDGTYRFNITKGNGHDLYVIVFPR